MKRAIAGLLLLSMGIFTATGCDTKTETDATIEIESSTQVSAKNWSESTHSNSVEPDYDTVFDQSKVLEFNIEIDSEDWATMQEDLEGTTSVQDGGIGNKPEQGRQPLPEGKLPQNGVGDEVGEVPSNSRPEGGPPAQVEGETQEKPPITAPGEGRQPLMNNGLEEETVSSDNPIWVESSITFDDTTWDHVGIRVKGNSSLKSAVSSGNNKLSFKLDFDEFEELYPEINNQRFYGYKQLNLNNNYADESLMRDKVSADLFREFGLTAANTTFAVVYLDHGEGSEFYGVYTLLEEMDDTVIENQLGDDSGNLYKPEGRAASFASGTYNDEMMDKKNNEDEADYSDVKALYEVINREDLETDPETWKSDLEDVFDVDGFLKWLAANTVMQNWDTYGTMTHNYYLYHNPETNKLEWIPWDNNEALKEGKANRQALSLGLDEVNNNWPLIRYLMDEVDYKTIYDTYVYEFNENVFTEEKMVETYTKYFEMIKEYAYAEVEGYSYITSDQSFDAAVDALKSHVADRNEAVTSYLKE